MRLARSWAVAVVPRRAGLGGVPVPLLGGRRRGSCKCDIRLYSGVLLQQQDIVEPPKEDAAFPARTLSPPDLSTINKLARFRELSQVLPMFAALIQAGQMEEAEQLAAAIQKSRSAEWAAHRDASLANMFIRGYIERGDTPRLKRWKEWLWSRQSAQPDALSYALMFRLYVERGRMDWCQKLADKMALDHVTLDGVLAVNYLLPDQALQLRRLLEGDAVVAAFDPASVSSPRTDLVSLAPLGSDLNLLLLNAGAAHAPRTLDHLPAVAAIKSKSDGVAFLREALKILHEDPSADLYSVQERLERDCYEAASKRLLSELESFKAATKAPVHTASIKLQIALWQRELTQEIVHALADASEIHRTSPRSVKSGSGLFYSSLLSALEPEKIALVCIQELTRPSNYEFQFGGYRVSRIGCSVGASLEREVFAKQLIRSSFLENSHLSSKHLARVFQSRRLFELTMRKQYAAMERNMDALREGWIPRWSAQVRAEVGVFVLSLAVRRLHFTDEAGQAQPAFSHQLRHSGVQSVGVVAVHPDFFKQLSREAVGVMCEPWSMPMLVPPRPWLTFNSGGYLTQRMPCVRMKEDPVHLALIHQADKRGALDRLLAGLDALGRTAWRINEGILRVALEMWNGGVNVATLEQPAPPGAPAAASLLEYRARDTFASQEEYVAYVRKAAEARESVSKAHSTMCDTNYKLEIARQFAGLPFYLPHSVDFRGRAYPIPPHLSHVGSDLSRGLLVFAEGQPLGPHGLRWLKIQLANMAGFDKASLDEREAYTDQHRALILDSADNPLGGEQWWRKADEPWQCLAACMEVAAAWRAPDPAAFVSHLPCQQDGSCNGLQHYAALGGDVDGARQVNLAPADRPQDVYAAVAKLVAAQVEADAAQDPTHIAARLLGKVNRKIVKQTVMTNVYGVTLYGARQQIQERLKEFAVVGPEDYKAARTYLAGAVFRSLGTLFDNAQKIQNWLTAVATEITRAVPPEVAAKFGSARGVVEVDTVNADAGADANADGAPTDPADRYPQTSVMWTTPLGFEVLQPYVKAKVVTLRTVLQSLSLKISSKFDPVDVGKQASAMPPNFVHSLDATHMFLTALASAEAGITFASVHDCFWTHAASVDTMNQLIREQFVAMHSQPILDKLRSEFLQRYRGYMVPEGGIERCRPSSGKDAPTGASGDLRYLRVARWRPISIPPVPPRGDFDITQVLQSEYFFS